MRAVCEDDGGGGTSPTMTAVAEAPGCCAAGCERPENTTNPSTTPAAATPATMSPRLRGARVVTTFDVAPNCETPTGDGPDVGLLDARTMRATRSAEMAPLGAKGAIASARACTSGNRSSGFFARHFMTAATSG